MDGVLLIDKPAGLTSHDVVAQARRILREKRIGHTGTLDPFATGLLVLLVGRATRLGQFVGSEKEYEAVIRLGFATTTGDALGERLPNNTQPAKLTWSDREIEKALAQLRGSINQVPPMYSAKKRGGQKLYELARRGETVAREPVGVTIYAFDPLGDAGQLLKENVERTSDLRARVVCSAGTYVRTLAEDLGRLLGVPAHLAELRRIRAGDFLVTDATTLEQLKQVVEEGSIGTSLLSPKAALSRLPFVHLSSEDAQKARHGMAISYLAANWNEGENVALVEEDRLIGVASYDLQQQVLKPRVIVAVDN